MLHYLAKLIIVLIASDKIHALSVMKDILLSIIYVKPLLHLVHAPNKIVFSVIRQQELALNVHQDLS